MDTHHDLDRNNQRIEAIEERLDQDYPGWRGEYPLPDLLVNGSIQQRTVATHRRLQRLESFVFGAEFNSLKSIR